MRHYQLITFMAVLGLISAISAERKMQKVDVKLSKRGFIGVEAYFFAPGALCRMMPQLEATLHFNSGQEKRIHLSYILADGSERKIPIEGIGPQHHCQTKYNARSFYGPLEPGTYQLELAHGHFGRVKTFALLESQSFKGEKSKVEFTTEGVSLVSFSAGARLGQRYSKCHYLGFIKRARQSLSFILPPPKRKVAQTCRALPRASARRLFLYSKKGKFSYRSDGSFGRTTVYLVKPQ